jgi:hypothetical protein
MHSKTKVTPVLSGELKPFQNHLDEIRGKLDIR